jgi:hypothetical protein
MLLQNRGKNLIIHKYIYIYVGSTGSDMTLPEGQQNLSFPNNRYQPHILVVEPVNTNDALVTQYMWDKLNNSCGGNAIDIHVFINGSLMARRVQAQHQDRAGRLTTC